MDLKQIQGKKVIDTSRDEDRVALMVKNADWPWYYFLIAGVAFSVFTVWHHLDMTSAIQQGRTVYLSRRVAFLYDIFGIWGVTGVLAAISIGLIGVSIWCYVSPMDTSMLDDEPKS